MLWCKHVFIFYVLLVNFLSSIPVALSLLSPLLPFLSLSLSLPIYDSFEPISLSTSYHSSSFKFFYATFHFALFLFLRRLKTVLSFKSITMQCAKNKVNISKRGFNSFFADASIAWLCFFISMHGSN